MPDSMLEDGAWRIWIKTRGWFVERGQVGVVKHGAGQCQTRLYPRRVAPDPEVQGVVDAEAGRRLLDGGGRAEPVELGRVDQVVPAAQAVVEGGFGGAHPTPPPPPHAVDGAVPPEYPPRPALPLQ